jgi:sulfate permease, SulP family
MYNASVYTPFVPSMARLLVGANALHQLTMTLLSSLPFVIGQVQDIGLILIRVETLDISKRLAGQPIERIMGTAMVAAMLSNIALGLCFILVGKRRLAGLVSYMCALRCIESIIYKT